MTCTIFTGHIRKDGYGQLWSDGKMRRAHRVAYKKHHNIDWSEMPEVIRHKCDNPSCVNVDHLEPGTQLDNIEDTVNRNRTSSKEKHWKAKLSQKDVECIRKACASGEWGCQARMARKFNVSKQTVSNIITGKGWT